jgi:hypothetical protein
MIRFSVENDEMTWIEIVPGLKVQKVACPGGSGVGKICFQCFGQSPLPVETLHYFTYFTFFLGWAGKHRLLDSVLVCPPLVSRQKLELESDKRLMLHQVLS